MAIDEQKVERVRGNRINEFSNHLMSNSKWLKLFKALSSVHEKIDDCFVIDIYRSTPIKLEIPTNDSFSSVFHPSGIQDVLLGGPILFKEIRWIEITSERYLTEILSLLYNIGELSIEKTQAGLRIYGYM